MSSKFRLISASSAQSTPVRAVISQRSRSLFTFFHVHWRGVRGDTLFSPSMVRNETERHRFERRNVHSDSVRAASGLTAEHCQKYISNFKTYPLLRNIRSTTERFFSRGRYLHLKSLPPVIVRAFALAPCRGRTTPPILPAGTETFLFQSSDSKFGVAV